MTTLIHIADRVLNRPLLVTRDKAQVILSVLAGRIGVNSPEASRFEGTSGQRDEQGNWKFAPYNVSKGVAIITVTGSLVNRGAWIGANSGLTSYEGIQHQLKTALNDSAVHSVILDLHSPGGEAVGAFETAAKVRELAAVKPTVAIVNGMAASAAYAIASGAREIVTTETGVSGSIGVVLLHADFSRNLDKEGITPTLIFAGDHKVDGNPFEPLPESVRTDLQAEVDAFYDLFVRNVAQGRGGRTSADMARATQARMFIGEAAVAAGLADKVGTFDSVLSDLSRASEGTRTNAQSRRIPMSDKTGAPAADAGISQADHQAAVTAAEQRGAATATARLAGILGAEGVKGDAARMSAALDLAVKAPAMAAADVTAFVKDNVAAKPAGKTAEAVLAGLDAAAAGVNSTPSATGAAPAAPAASTPEGWKAEYAANAKLQADYATAEDYAAFKQAEASGKVKVLGARK